MLFTFSFLIVLTSFLLNFGKEMFNFCLNFRSDFIVLISFLLNIGKEMSLPGFRTKVQYTVSPQIAQRSYINT